jgi:sporulation protein YtfJ
MSEHPIQGLMNTALQNIREMVDVNTIIGDQIVTSDGTVIIPVSKVSLGFASGGSDFPTKSDKEMFGGGSGAGASISPIAFIIVSNGNVKLLQITSSSSVADNAISLVPELFDKITGLFGKNKKKCKEDAAGQPDAGVD